MSQSTFVTLYVDVRTVRDGTRWLNCCRLADYAANPPLILLVQRTMRRILPANQVPSLIEELESQDLHLRKRGGNANVKNRCLESFPIPNPDYDLRLWILSLHYFQFIFRFP